MSAHTPGPWIVLPESLGSIVTADKRLDIAQAHATKAVRTSADHAERMANARLIAAAPELLAALELAQVWIQEARVSGCVPTRAENTARTISAALAKAGVS